MGDIGARQVRYEVLPTSTHPEHVEPVESRAGSAAERVDPAPQDLRAARAEPARS